MRTALLALLACACIARAQTIDVTRTGLALSGIQFGTVAELAPALGDAPGYVTVAGRGVAVTDWLGWDSSDAQSQAEGLGVRLWHHTILQAGDGPDMQTFPLVTVTVNRGLPPELGLCRVPLMVCVSAGLNTPRERTELAILQWDPRDVNLDGFDDVRDFAAFLERFQRPRGYDYNSDGASNVIDFLSFLNAGGTP